jgi:hypothetical protein
MNLNDRAVEIVVICDIYDALSASRPYRPVSFDNRSAIEEITLMAERGDVAGKWFRRWWPRTAKGSRISASAAYRWEKGERPRPGICMASLQKTYQFERFDLAFFWAYISSSAADINWSSDIGDSGW